MSLLYEHAHFCSHLKCTNASTEISAIYVNTSSKYYSGHDGNMNHRIVKKRKGKRNSYLQIGSLELLLWSIHQRAALYYYK